MNKKKKYSLCCNAETGEVYEFYNTTMTLKNGKPIPKVSICLKCGHRCSTFG